MAPAQKFQRRGGEAQPAAGLRERARMAAGAVVVDGFFRGMSRLGAMHPRARPERHDLEHLTDIHYGPDPMHTLDVWRPTSPGPHPVAMYVHGGGFRVLSKETHWIMALALARRGYVVFNINYRLSRHAPYPAAAQDTLLAWQWVLEHAARFGGDTSHVIVGGESAGANLCASLCVATCWPREEPWARRVWELGRVPDAVLAACGIFQVSEAHRFWQRKPHMPTWLRDRLVEVSHSYLDGDHERHRPGAHDLADPLVFLERAAAPERDLPPFMIPVGTRDPLLEDARRMERALARHGAPCHAPIYPGEVHAFHAFVWREQARRCWRDIYAFLEDARGGQ